MIDLTQLDCDVTSGATVLVVEGPTADGHHETCHDLITPVEPARMARLVVTYRQSPDEWRADWDRSIGEQPAAQAFISPGESVRSATAAAGAGATAGPSTGAGASQLLDLAIHSVPAGDLTELGMTVSKQLAEWQGTDLRPVVCFDSISAMLQWSELETAFRFLHVLGARLAANEAIAHFHVDPTVTTEEEIATLEPLFDAVIRPDDPTAADPATDAEGTSATEGMPPAEGEDDAAGGQPLDRQAATRILQEPRRRALLRTLVDRPGYLGVGDLAAALREAEIGDTGAGSKTLEVLLHHTDLPKLEEVGVLTYDTADNIAKLTVEKGVARQLLQAVGES